MKKKNLFIILTIVSIVILGIGGTFAYYTTSAVVTNITQIKSGNLTMTVDGGGNTNTSFMPAKCTSEYAIKKKIVATSTNTSGGKVSFSIGMNITTLSDSLKRESMRYTLTTNASSCTDGIISSGSFKNKTVGSDVWLIKNDYDNITHTNNSYTKTYYLYIWLDEEETQNLSGSILVNMKGTSSNNPSLTMQAYKVLFDMIKGNADITTNIDFSKTSEQDNTNGIYMTKDTDSGIPVYYYRGNVDNHVLFANFCWRIIRTTETGGLKLIYDGIPREKINFIEESSYTNITYSSEYSYYFDSTNKKWYNNENDDSSTQTITFSVNKAGDYVLSYSSGINFVEYEIAAKFYKNGIMLEEHSGDADGTITLKGLTTSDVIKVEFIKYYGTLEFGIGKITEDRACNNSKTYSTIGYSAFNSTRDDAKYVGYMYGSSIDDTENTTDSTIKTAIDTWYKNNMIDYTSYLEDTVFCNDRVYANDSTTDFNATQRMELFDLQPTLKCQNAKDKFTVETSNGNGDLIYPVGLITVDEINYAGAVLGRDGGDSNFYLNTDRQYWSMTPYRVDSDATYEPNAESYYLRRGDYSGSAIGNTYSVDTSMGIRPVISLKPGTAISGGSGTATDPFVIG